MTPEDAYQRATAVFVGRVVTVTTRYTPRTRRSGHRPYHEVQLAVETSWKLVDRQEVTISTTNTLQGTCGSFIAGETYLVYADALNDTLFVSPGSRTNRLADAGEDLRVLGEARLPLRSGEFRTYKVILYGALVCVALALLLWIFLYRLNKKPLRPA
ncbi:MAG TPA: hypothetical protein VJT50_01375 [Pyrinomonadaceae bacterium]|nr:hypothetical protein [Pyrinomonadaceae bacterium]